MHTVVNDCRGRDGRRHEAAIVTRPATAADIIEYYGEAHSKTLRANVAVMDGRCIGLVGVSREKDWGLFFSDVKPELQPYLKSVQIMRCVKQALRYVREYKGPVVSIAESAEGCRILNRLGFTHLYGAWYGWLK